MMIPEIIKSQFPNRLLTINKVIVFNFTVMRVLLIALIAGLFFSLYLGVPGLINDYKISQDPVTVKAKVSGSCETQYFIVTSCDVTINYKGNRVERTFFFFDPSQEGYRVTVKASRSDPSLMSIDLAIEKFWNRVVTFLILQALFVTIIISSINSLQRSKRMIEVLEQTSGHRLLPVLVPVKLVKAGNTEIANYRWPDALNGEKYVASFKIKKEGGVLRVGEYALGVAKDAFSAPILLDKKLQRIDMTEQERAQLWQAIADYEAQAVSS